MLIAEGWMGCKCGRHLLFVWIIDHRTSFSCIIAYFVGSLIITFILFFFAKIKKCPM
jgi:uncharacterized membrane protein YeaQ/YmgE (transglycosylase-associated protein family)